MKVFISHSHDDKQIVRRIVDDLNKNGVEVWLDENLISPGELWTDKITEALQSSDVILVIMSRNTSESRWQTFEIAFSVAAQRGDPSKRIIPVLVDRQADVPFFLTGLAYCDLSSEEKYKHNFESLLRVLSSQSGSTIDMKEADRRKIEAIKTEKEMFQNAMEGLAKKKAIWTSTVLGASASAIAALVGLVVGSIAIVPSMVAIFKRYGDLLAGVLVGVISSLIAFLVARRVQNRATRKEGEDAQR